jgi:hypothetical protein
MAIIADMRRFCSAQCADIWWHEQQKATLTELYAQHSEYKGELHEQLADLLGFICQLETKYRYNWGLLA